MLPKMEGMRAANDAVREVASDLILLRRLRRTFQVVVLADESTLEKKRTKVLSTMILQLAKKTQHVVPAVLAVAAEAN